MLSVNLVSRAHAHYADIDKNDSYPKKPCSKCGSTFWEREEISLHWRCTKCGNRGNWYKGEFFDSNERSHVLGN